jgi:hypothetical protein
MRGVAIGGFYLIWPWNEKPPYLIDTTVIVGAWRVWRQTLALTAPRANQLMRVQYQKGNARSLEP